MTSSNLQSSAGLSLLTKYFEGTVLGRLQKTNVLCLISVQSSFLSRPQSLRCHMPSTTQVMQNEAELIANKQHKQMLCQALAGAALMQASTVACNKQSQILYSPFAHLLQLHIAPFHLMICFSIFLDTIKCSLTIIKRHLKVTFSGE